MSVNSLLQLGWIYGDRLGLGGGMHSTECHSGLRTIFRGRLIHIWCQRDRGIIYPVALDTLTVPRWDSLTLRENIDCVTSFSSCSLGKWTVFTVYNAFLVLLTNQSTLQCKSHSYTFSQSFYVKRFFYHKPFIHCGHSRQGPFGGPVSCPGTLGEEPGTEPSAFWLVDNPLYQLKSVLSGKCLMKVMLTKLFLIYFVLLCLVHGIILFFFLIY